MESFWVLEDRPSPKDKNFYPVFWIARSRWLRISKVEMPRKMSRRQSSQSMIGYTR